MRPAFSSRAQAAAFGVLIVVLLALPALVAKSRSLGRRDIYPAVAVKYGPFSWIQQKIFDESGDVDIAFLGSSHIWSAVDTPHVQRTLSEKLGRRAEVFTLGWPWAGFDGLYVVARDLLEQRRVRVLVIYDEVGTDAPHPHSSRWFVIGQNSEILDDLPLEGQIGLYGGAVLGMPRHLLSLVRKDRTENPQHGRPNWWNSYYRAPSVAERLGAIRARLAFGVLPSFVPVDVKSRAAPSDVLVYSVATRDGFAFTGPPTSFYQLQFARRLAALCRERGTRLVVLHTPSFSERAVKVVQEREVWPERFGAPVDIVGIPPAKLFQSLQEEIQALFYEDTHMNQNGQDMFTPVITPALIALHAQSTLTQ